MDFSFNIEFAKRYGVDEAIMVKSFQFWIRLNKANKVNYHDLRYWTYNTNKSLTEYYPFWSEKQVRRIIESLVDKEILIKGNYNKIAYDRTIWYAFINEDLYLSDNFHLEEIGDYQKVNTILPNGQMEKTKRSNRFTQKGEPIPVTNQILNTITNSILSENSKEFSPIEINGIEIKENKNGKVNPFQLISELQKEETKESCAKENKERKPNPTYEAFTIFCETFERLSGANYPKDKNGNYLMSKKDAGGMVYLMRNVQQVDRNGNSIEALKVFVTAAWNLNDKWIRANFTPNTLYGQFSKIFTGYQTSSPEMIEKKKNDRIAELLAEKMKQYEND
jgi:hypothetical protein